MSIPSFRARSPTQTQEKSVDQSKQEFNRDSYQQWKKEMGIEDEDGKSSSSSTLIGHNDEVTVGKRTTTQTSETEAAYASSKISLVDRQNTIRMKARPSLTIATRVLQKRPSNKFEISQESSEGQPLKRWTTLTKISIKSPMTSNKNASEKEE